MGVNIPLNSNRNKYKLKAVKIHFVQENVDVFEYVQ